MSIDIYTGDYSNKTAKSLNDRDVSYALAILKKERRKYLAVDDILGSNRLSIPIYVINSLYKGRNK